MIKRYAIAFFLGLSIGLFFSWIPSEIKYCRVLLWHAAGSDQKMLRYYKAVVENDCKINLETFLDLNQLLK